MQRASYLLVLNAGSSSLKLEVFDGAESALRAQVAGIGRERSELVVDGVRSAASEPIPDHRAAARSLFDALGGSAHHMVVEPGCVIATAHRVVHGGAAFAAPVLVTDAILRRIEALEPLAPLHNPAAVAVMQYARERFPASATAAVFDTALFAELPEAASVYALPAKLRRDLAIRRYGFHGIAHEYLYRRYSELVPVRAGRDRVVSFQLGQGCSATAFRDGRPVETSMGYTPLEGLIMGTRCGDLDPGVVLALARAGWTWPAIEHALQQESGLRALSQGSDDMRDVLAAAAKGSADAELALTAFCHRAAKYLGAYAAVLGGVDAVIFGGGIGENAAEVRARICARAEWLGLKLDAAANQRCAGAEGSIAAPGSAVDAYVIPVREEPAIARAARELLDLDARGF